MASDVCDTCKETSCYRCPHHPDANGGPSTETTPHREMPTCEIGTPSMQDVGGACNPSMREEYLLSMLEFAQIARMSYEQIRRLVAQKKIRHLRIGKTVRIPSGVLTEYIGGQG